MIHSFEIQLADVDRQVYESISLRVARHQSETEDYLLTRVLAYCLEFTEGIALSAGLSDPDEPSIAVRDLTGTLRTWIDIGAPDAARIHRASKAAPRVAIYTHRNPDILLRQYAGERIHRAASVELYAIDREFLAQLAARLERRMQFDLSITDHQLYVTLGDATLTGEIVRHAIAAP